MFGNLIWKVLSPIISKKLGLQLPVSPTSQTRFPVTDTKVTSFDPFSIQPGSARVSGSGSYQFQKGDYLIPVATFCLKASASSPRGHTYTLSQLEGSRAQVLKTLLIRGGQDNHSQLQHLIWNIQAGIALSQMDSPSQELATLLVPEHQEELEGDFLEKLETTWGSWKKTLPLLPDWNTITDETLDRLGEPGEWLKTIIRTREKIRKDGNRYETFSDTVSILQSAKFQETPWSEIKPGLKGRFITQGSFGFPGVMQLRAEDKVDLNVSELVADSGASNVQPLALAAIAIPMAGLPLPAVLAMLALAIALANYDQIIDLLGKIPKGNSDLEEVRRKAEIALAAKHDEMEKPLKDAGTLDGATRTNDPSEAGVRNYEKPGGTKQMEKDFDRIPGTESPSSGDVRLKLMPNGDKVVMRGHSKTGPPTLEVQPGDRTRTRVKVRYR